MHTLDLIVIAYIAAGAARGRRRGLADEGYRLLRVGFSLLAGCGLYAALRGLLEHVAGWTGMASFVVTYAGAFALLRLIRSRVQGWLAERFAPPAQRLGGTIAGALHAFAIAVVLLTALGLSPLTKDRLNDAWVGRATLCMLGGSETKEAEEVP